MEKNHLFKNLTVVKKSITINFLFWFIAIICLICITEFSDDKSYFNSFFTFIFAMLIGWYIHYLSHAYDLLDLYEKSNNKVINKIKSFKYLDFIIKKFILYTTDFHDKIHHNTAINKQSFNLFWEFFQNFLMEGGILIIFSNLFNLQLKVGNHVFKFNKAVLFLWGVLYASVHNINYILLGCDQHVNHHKDIKTNYGIDILDILFDTKFDLQNIEEINHAALNLLIITLLIIYFKIYID
jgi:hypothetical protein